MSVSAWVWRVPRAEQGARYAIAPTVEGMLTSRTVEAAAMAAAHADDEFPAKSMAWGMVWQSSSAKVAFSVKSMVWRESSGAKVAFPAKGMVWGERSSTTMVTTTVTVVPTLHRREDRPRR